MARLQAVRRALGVRTVMNLCGPLTNPALPDRQLVGAWDEAAARKLASALAALQARALVVTGQGFDEATPTGPFLALDVRDGVVTEQIIDPGDLGFPRCAPDALAGGEPEDNARALLSVLDGARGPARDAIVLNAALALALCDLSFVDARRAVEEALDDGRARALLAAMRTP
jgi:anthranilate phosphoribosyltransferase